MIPEQGSGPIESPRADGWAPEPIGRGLWHGRVAAIVEVVACSGFPTQVALSGLLALAGVRPYDAAGHLSRLYVFSLSAADAAALVGLAFYFMWLHGEKPSAVLLGTRPVAGEALLGLLQIPILFGLVVLVLTTILRLAPWLHDVPRNPMEGLIGSTLDAVLFVAIAVVAGGIREEVQRAFILQRFEKHLGGGWLGLVLFSGVFGAGHVIQGTDVAVTTAVLGLFWGAVYLRRRSIASTVVSHAGFNAAEIIRYALR